MELLLQVGTFCVAVGALIAGMPFICNKIFMIYLVTVMQHA